MPIRKNIFDSKSEQILYKGLLRNWGGRFDILPHIPLKNVIDFNGLNISDGEREFLNKTYFDYVITSLEDERLGEAVLVIEFDGLGMGYSSSGKYIQVKETGRDPYRKLKMDCKIRICEQEGLPLVVVSYPETCAQIESFSILDGIIGRVLAHRELTERLTKPSCELEERLENVGEPWEQQLIIEDYCIEQEVSAKLNNNPIAVQSSGIKMELIQRGIVRSFRFTFLYENDQAGCEYSTYQPNGERISERVFVREVNCKFTDAGLLAKDFAELLLLKKVATIYGVN